MTPGDRPSVTAFICVTCRGAGGDDERPRRLLFEAVTASLRARTDCDVTVTPVECLSVCKRPCTVALVAAGKWTYVVGDLSLDANLDDIVTAARRFARTRDGLVPWRERPLPFRKGVISRTPPLATAEG